MSNIASQALRPSSPAIKPASTTTVKQTQTQKEGTPVGKQEAKQPIATLAKDLTTHNVALNHHQAFKEPTTLNENQSYTIGNETRTLQAFKNAPTSGDEHNKLATNLETLMKECYDLMNSPSELNTEDKAKINFMLNIIENPEFENITKTGEFKPGDTSYNAGENGNDACQNWVNAVRTQLEKTVTETTQATPLPAPPSNESKGGAAEETEPKPDQTAKLEDQLAKLQAENQKLQDENKELQTLQEENKDLKERINQAGKFNNVVAELNINAANKEAEKAKTEATAAKTEATAKDAEGTKKEDKAKDGADKKPDEKKPPEKKPAEKK